MAMESTLQVRMDSALKAEVEALYKSLGTSFDARLRKSMADVSAGRVLSQDQLDAKMREKFARE